MIVFIPDMKTFLLEYQIKVLFMLKYHYCLNIIFNGSISRYNYYLISFCSTGLTGFL